MKRLRPALACITLAFALTTLAQAPAPEEAAFVLNGTWIGWAWLGEAGDLPLRVRMATTPNQARASFDSPAHGFSGAPFRTVDWERPKLSLTGETPEGTAVSLTGTLRDNEIRGSIRWSSHEGSFELKRSPRPLATVAPGSYADAAGFYERTPGNLVELRARPWGELLYRELRTGRVRTLLPVAENRFFIGAGIYDPHPIEAEINLVRDDSGKLMRIEERPTTGPARTAAPIPLIEENVSFSSEGATLAGTLLRRAGTERRPAVVLLGGSSWETRADVSFHARNLAALGYAVLSFDRRGHGESGGNAVAPFVTTARDAVAGVELLATRRFVDPARIGVFGMSRGGWQAPIAASLSDRVSFLILLVPPAVSPAAQETRSRLDQMRRDGFDSARIALASKVLTSTWTWVREKNNWDEYSILRSTAVAAGIPDYVLESDSPEPAEWEWARLNMFYDPCPVLGKLAIPVLAIFAENDIYVSEEINRNRLRQCLGRRARLTVHTIPGAGHNLAVPNQLPIHKQSGRGDEGFTAIADWTLRNKER